MDKNTLIKDFSDRIDKLYEVEYGDFKRKVGQYLMKLESSLASHIRKNPEAKKIIQEMSLRIIYSPEPNIEKARQFALECASRLQKTLTH